MSLSPLPTPGAGSDSTAPILVIATRNPGKMAEFERLLAGHGWRLLSADQAGVRGELTEPGPGYRENAVAKATAVMQQLGVAALGDDSGIEVPALRGWPGPHSARWRLGSDWDRLQGLLEVVERQCPGDRRVRYVAVVALARPHAEPVVAHGSCEGLLVHPRGHGGFGYDPAFLSDDLGATFGQADRADKDCVSHRARAVARLAESQVLDVLDVSGRAVAPGFDHGRHGNPGM